ncbi:hypothetical protein ABFP60_07905 [Clostridioides difficile]
MKKSWYNPKLINLGLEMTNEDEFTTLTKPRPDSCYCDEYDTSDGNESHNHAHGAMKNKEPGDPNYCECCSKLNLIS